MGSGPVTVNDIFGTSVPVGTLVYSFDGTRYQIEEFIEGEPNFWDPGTNDLSRGKGFWYKAPSAGMVSMVGDVPGSSTAATTGVRLVEGFQLLSFPYPVSTSITNTVLNSVASVGDIIYQWINGGWALSEFLEGTGWETLVVFQPGEGFWYRRADGNGPASFSEQKPNSFP
jgi:hypothetical protein